MLAQHQAMIDKFSAAYAELTAEKIAHFPDLYADDVVFMDPVQQIYSVQDLQVYFFRIIEQTYYHRVKVIRAFSSDNDVFILWELSYAHANLEQGDDIPVEGASHLRLEGERIIFQRNYYDMGAMLYEHIPLISRVVHYMKGKIAGFNRHD